MKYFKYFKYVFRHKYYVFLYMAQHGYFWRGLLHDLSKFRLDECRPYAEYFYGKNGHAESDKDGVASHGLNMIFDAAWLKHIHRNPHHHQHWLLKEDNGNLKPLPMPKKYLIEMFCDWQGASTAIFGKNNTPNWYEVNKDKIILHPDTRKDLETLIQSIKTKETK